MRTRLFVLLTILPASATWSFAGPPDDASRQSPRKIVASMALVDSPPRACAPGQPCATAGGIHLTIDEPLVVWQQSRIVIDGVPVSELPNLRVSVAPETYETSGTPSVVKSRLGWNIGVGLAKDSKPFIDITPYTYGDFTFTLAAPDGQNGILFTTQTISVSQQPPPPPPTPGPTPQPTPGPPAPPPPPVSQLSLVLITQSSSGCPACDWTRQWVSPTIRKTYGDAYREVEHGSDEANRLYPSGVRPRWIVTRPDGTTDKREGPMIIGEVQTFIKGK